MDAGVAALLGAGVGVLGTSAAAVLAGQYMRWQVHTQAVVEHELWRRQGRRDAYAALLSSLTELLVLTEKLNYQLVGATVDFAEVRTLVDESNSGLNASVHAVSIVRIEGPDAVLTPVMDALDGAFHLCNALMDLETARQTGVAHGPADQACTTARSELVMLIEAFRVAAREALDASPIQR